MISRTFLKQIEKEHQKIGGKIMVVGDDSTMILSKGMHFVAQELGCELVTDKEEWIDVVFCYVSPLYKKNEELINYLKDRFETRVVFTPEFFDLRDIQLILKEAQKYEVSSSKDVSENLQQFFSLAFEAIDRDKTNAINKTGIYFQYCGKSLNGMTLLLDLEREYHESQMESRLIRRKAFENAKSQQIQNTVLRMQLKQGLMQIMQKYNVKECKGPFLLEGIASCSNKSIEDITYPELVLAIQVVREIKAQL